MATVRWWRPTTDFMTATRVIDRMFDQFFGFGQGDQESGGPATYALPVDVLETNDSFLLYATVAGTSGDDVDVTFEDGVLTISVNATPLEGQGRLLRQERPWGNWSRKLELPKEVDPANIVAEFDNGVLTVRVPKAARAEPQRIAIRTAGKAIEG
jgi:HSP20 family protein